MARKHEFIRNRRIADMGKNIYWYAMMTSRSLRGKTARAGEIKKVRSSLATLLPLGFLNLSRPSSSRI